MESQKCKVTISGKEYLYEKGTSYQEIAKDFQKEYKHQIALVMLDGHRLQELRKQVSGDCTLQFITTQDTAGYDTYRRSVCFLFIKAVHDVIGHERPQQVRVRIHFRWVRDFTARWKESIMWEWNSNGKLKNACMNLYSRDFRSQKS